MVGCKYKNYIYFNIDLLISATFATVTTDLAIGMYQQYGKNIMTMSVVALLQDVEI
jgi:hypothetical protein